MSRHERRHENPWQRSEFGGIDPREWVVTAGPGRGRGPRGRGRRGWEGDLGFGRGPRAARGDIRTAVLVLLGEEPMHGYQIIQELQERSNGMWDPSPGSIYPKLARLREEGLVEQLERSGKKVFGLTDAGRDALEELPVDGRAPWDDLSAGGDPDEFAMRDLVGQLAHAAMQVGRIGSERQVRAAKEALDETRRRLYALLSEREEDEQS